VATDGGGVVHLRGEANRYSNHWEEGESSGGGNLRAQVLDLPKHATGGAKKKKKRGASMNPRREGGKKLSVWVSCWRVGGGE